MTPCKPSPWPSRVRGYARKGPRYHHREVYVEHHGPIPPKHTVDHTCHNVDPTCPGGDTCWHRDCIEPSHLEAVPRGTNVLRGKSGPANNARKTVCPSCGRPYDRLYPSGGRHCSVCDTERNRSQRRRNT